MKLNLNFQRGSGGVDCGGVGVGGRGLKFRKPSICEGSTCMDVFLSNLILHFSATFYTNYNVSNKFSLNSSSSLTMERMGARPFL